MHMCQHPLARAQQPDSPLVLISALFIDQHFIQGLAQPTAEISGGSPADEE
jgi:hypothetical protein